MIKYLSKFFLAYEAYKCEQISVKKFSHIHNILSVSINGVLGG